MASNVVLVAASLQLYFIIFNDIVLKITHNLWVALKNRYALFTFKKEGTEQSDKLKINRP